MAGFSPFSSFTLYDERPLQLLPLRFERLTANTYLVANIVGESIVISRGDLEKIIDLDVVPGDGLYEKAASKLLIARRGANSPLQLLALRLRSRMSFLQSVTSLHLFVVTLRCEHSCPYCQVSRRSSNTSKYDMDEPTAMKALDIALSSPAQEIKLEFQGGEPLLNFDLISKIVLEARQKGTALGKAIQYVITTNLALLNDAILDFCRANHILLSTSLDGPKDLHNKNRPRPGGNSYELTVANIRRAQERLGRDRVGALMTTTESSLRQPREIIDEYLRLDLDGIFLRPLSPYGFAIKTKWIDSYGIEDWLKFYEEGLRYIIEVNRSGRHFPEHYAALMLQRMHTDSPTGYVDLRSPAGIGLGALVYNYDGKIYASDEGRMLAEMGDKTFQIGDVSTDDFRSLILSDRLVDAISQSLAQCSPMCATCAYEPVCGADPVYHHATQDDIVGIKPLSGFCARQKGVVPLLTKLLSSSEETEKILLSWIRR